jgi:hypothetical protein
MMRTTIAKGCLYCGLRLPDDVDFCPECGRPIEKGLVIHAARQAASACPDTNMVQKNGPVRQQVACSNVSDIGRPLQGEDKSATIQESDERANPIGVSILPGDSGRR